MALFSSFIIRDVIASRPAAGENGRLFFATDEGKTYRDSGSAWLDVTNNNASNLASGTVPAARLPNPSTSTLGGVQSIVAVSHQFLTSISTSGVPALAQPTEADLSLSDITTNNVSITKHGLAPKAPNDATKYLDGTGAYTTPSGTGTGTVTSVALTVPSWLSVAGSPVTTSGTLAVTATTGQTANFFLATPNGSTGAASLRAIVQADLPAQPVDIPCSLTGKPGAAAIVLIFTATRALSFAANFSGAYGTVGTNPTSTAAYDVLKNGASIGTVSISTSGVFTFTTASGTSKSLAAGDRLTITGPASQDATLSDVGFTLTATR